MNRVSNGSYVGSLSTPTATRSWGSQRPIELEKQLFQRATAALEKLRRIPGFEDYETFAMQPAESLPAHLQYSLDVTPPGMPVDRVTVIFRVIRMGAPLSLAFNALNTETMLDLLSVESCRDLKEVKRAIYKFCEACVQDLQYKWDTDLFTISQVFHESINELMKPLSTLESVLERLYPSKRGSTNRGSQATNASYASISSNTSTSTTIGAPSTTASTTASANASTNASRASQHTSQESNESQDSSNSNASNDDQLSKVVNELLQTERKYVQDLELLQVYHDDMLKMGMPRETADKITPHIAKLLDYQRRLLVGFEYQFRLSPQQQNFGWLFLHLQHDAEICKLYTLSQKEATRTALLETSNLMPLSHIFEPTYELPATLLKPVQRIMRYPMLLKEIAKNTPSAWPHHHELLIALDAMHEMMSDVNETQRRAENTFIRNELEDRVKDWRGLDLSSLGELLLSGNFPCSTESEPEQDCGVYLFERVLLICKDRAISKKTPLTKIRTRSSQSRSMLLDIKGRIYLEYTCNLQIYRLSSGWKLQLGWGVFGTAEQGSFNIWLVNEEQAQLWRNAIDRQIRSCKRRFSRFSNTANSSTNSLFTTSPTSPHRGSQPDKWTRTVSTPVNGGVPMDDENSSFYGALFYDESSSPMETLRKLSVSSSSSQHTASSQHTTNSISSRGSYPSVHASHSVNHRHSRDARDARDSRVRLSDGASVVNTGGQSKVRIHINDDAFLILVPPEAGFEELQHRVERKLRLCGKTLPGAVQKLAFTYRDEDDDLVKLESDEDLLVALDSVNENQELTIYVK